MWGNKKINSEEFEKLSKQITSISSEQEILKTTLETLKTNVNSLRGLINRKISPEEKPEEEETQDIKGTKYY